METASSITNRKARTINGVLAALLVLALLALGVAAVIAGGVNAIPVLIAAGIILVIVAALSLPGFFLVQPNRSKVIIVLGRYIGTENRPGLWWTNPLSSLESRITIASATSVPVGPR